MRGIYTVQCSNLSVTTVVDLLAAMAGSGRKLVIHAVDINAKGQSAVANLRMRLVRLPATVTNGSGGSSVTPQKTDPLDAAAGFTARAGDTSQATTGGTASSEHSFDFNPITGYTFPFPEKMRPKCDLSEAFSLSLDDAPVGLTLVFNATMWVEEQ
jgi:hypothetical protein